MSRLPAVLTLVLVLAGCAEPPPADTHAAGSTTAFSKVQPDGAILFPRDHGEHPDYQLEWWYLTANLRDDQGRDYGAQWTLFRFALRPPLADVTPSAPDWQSSQLYFAHCALSSADWHLASERFARGATGLAAVAADPLSARIEDWVLHSDVSPGSPDPFASARAFCDAPGRFSLDLQIANAGPLVRHGKAGFSQKHPDPKHASWYYSAPFLRLSGVVERDGQPVTVTGQGWFDHEWTSALLSEEQVGWDWGSLLLDDGSRLMVFRVRGREGQDFFSGSFIDSSGQVETLAAEDFSMQPLDEEEPSRRWRITVPARELDVVIESLGENHWMELSTRYWESPVRVSGSHSGRGFLEMTGY